MLPDNRLEIRFVKSRYSSTFALLSYRSGRSRAKRLERFDTAEEAVEWARQIQKFYIERGETVPPLYRDGLVV